MGSWDLRLVKSLQFQKFESNLALIGDRILFSPETRALMVKASGGCSLRGESCPGH